MAEAMLLSGARGTWKGAFFAAQKSFFENSLRPKDQGPRTNANGKTLLSQL
jgi:hypothetical protein